MSEIECSRCKNKLPKNVCGASESQYYNQNIEPDGSCNCFLENPVQDYYIKGLKYFSSGFYNKAISELETAIKLGLPHDDEMSARLILGAAYSNLINHDLDIEGMVATKEFSEAINQMEKAVLMDFEDGYKFFEKPIYRALLSKLDVNYALQAAFIQEKQGIDSAIVFYQDKLRLFDYLPSIPMLITLLQLGGLYGKKGETDRARECYKKILDTDVVDPVDKVGTEAETRQMAKNNLQMLESKDKKCFIATAVYGDSNTYELVILKRFRDDVLLSYAIGRKVVSLYYLFSPYVASLVKKSSLLKQLLKFFVIKPIIWLINNTNRGWQKNNTDNE